MPIKKSWFVFILFCAGIMAYAIYRDIQLEQQYTSDLRNRVVGARLEKDHVSPYHYLWKPGDPIRYYDPSNQLQPGDSSVSNITGTPFLHHLMEPVAELPERTISRIWLLVEYLVFAGCAGIALALAASRRQKAMVLGGAVFFLLTEAWKSHITNGQYYLLIPFLALLFYWLFHKPGNAWRMAAAGLCAVVLVLIRPNCLVFFLPFLLLIRQYSRRSLLAFLLPVLLLTGWSLASGNERSLWLDYSKFLGQNIKMHQSLDVNAPPRNVKSYYTDWEGWHASLINEAASRYPRTAHSENGNVFILFNKITGIKTNVSILNAASALSLLLLCTLFIGRNRQTGYSPSSIAIFGFCLYMVTDLFSPVWRHQYYTLQWICPVLLAAAAYRPGQQKWFVLLAAGLLLNVLNIPFVKMEHTIGEYLMLLVLLWMSLTASRELLATSR